MTHGGGLHRREWLLGAGLWAAAPAFAATPVGELLPPAPAPAIELTDTQGRRSTLPALLRGRIGVVQLMFTGCSTVCPTQGLLFAQLAARARSTATGWLSISIDALGDDPARLAAWQARWGTHPAWQAAVPDPRDVDRLVAFLRGAAVRSGTHSTQVFVFDGAARLCHRSADDPGAAQIERVIAGMASA